MNTNPNSRANAALVVAMIALVVGSFLLGVRVSPSAAPATDTIGVQAVWPIRFTNSGTKMQFLTGSTLEIQAGTTETHGNTVVFSSESISPTNNAMITPTKTLVTFTNAAPVTVTLGACTTGQLVWLYGSTVNSVIITDTGNFLGAGNQTIGQYDAMGMVCIDSKWVQTSAVSAN